MSFRERTVGKSCKSYLLCNPANPNALLFQGSADRNVSSKQSELFKSELDKHNIISELYLVNGARHGDPIFDMAVYVAKTMQFLQEHFPVNKKRRLNEASFF